MASNNNNISIRDSISSTAMDREADDASTSSWSRPYPPTEQNGVVDEHDKPFFYYGHLGR